MILYCILLFIIFICILYKTRKSLYMLQQNLYNENNRYLKWVSKNIRDFLSPELIIIFLAALGYFVTFDLEMIPSILLLIIIALYGVEILRLDQDKNKEQNKISFKITARVKRLIITFTILMLIPTIFFILNWNTSSTAWLFIFIISMIVYLNRFIVYIVNIINKPIEKCVFLYYKTKAQNKLRDMSNLKVVGITGSYDVNIWYSCMNDQSLMISSLPRWEPM